MSQSGVSQTSPMRVQGLTDWLCRIQPA